MHPTSPRILVLLATHNGARYLPAQLDSVLAQRDVAVRILASDDASTDGTRRILADYGNSDARLTSLEPGRFGSATANFFRLIRDANATGFDAVAFCDQDDIWDPGKLAHQAKLLLNPNADNTVYAGVSSDVVAFTESGREFPVRKSQPQRRCDHLFESAGPGSTFLITPELFALVREKLCDHTSRASEAFAHDWLIYALARAAGMRWHIDPHLTVRYRQHASNVLGANQGAAQALRRLRSIAAGQYRERVRVIVAAAREVAAPSERALLDWLAARLTSRGPVNRLRLARRVGALRRRGRERLVLAGAMLLGLF